MGPSVLWPLLTCFSLIATVIDVEPVPEGRAAAAGTEALVRKRLAVGLWPVEVLFQLIFEVLS